MVGSFKLINTAVPAKKSSQLVDSMQCRYVRICVRLYVRLYVRGIWLMLTILYL